MSGMPASNPETLSVSATPTTTESTSSAPIAENQIATVIKSANDSEIKAGALAKTRAENPEVRAFARHIVDEHKKNNIIETEFSKKWDADSSETVASRNIRSEFNAKFAALEKISGSDFDEAYLQNQMAMHKQLLADLDNRYIPAAQDAKLKNYLLETRKNISRHLSSAQALASMLDR